MNLKRFSRKQIRSTEVINMPLEPKIPKKPRTFSTKKCAKCDGVFGVDSFSPTHSVFPGPGIGRASFRWLVLAVYDTQRKKDSTLSAQE